jgi:SAM-dependent methyltransferase
MKWEIPERGERSCEQPEAYWDSVHDRDRYTNVVSLTDDLGVRDRITRTLRDCEAKRILVPGAGSRVALQKHLVEKLPGLERLVCSDFPGVIALASASFPHDAIDYCAADSADLPWLADFDAAVVVNSILSDSDFENRQMLRSIRNALRPGGILIGFFPTVFASCDIAIVSHDAERRATVDLERSTKYEPAQDAYQIFYTPLRLRMILREAGFDIELMEVYFLDSDYFRAQEGEWNQFTIDDDDLAIYEHYVVARSKPNGSASGSHG